MPKAFPEANRKSAGGRILKISNCSCTWTSRSRRIDPGLQLQMTVSAESITAHRGPAQGRHRRHWHAINVTTTATRSRQIRSGIICHQCCGPTHSLCSRELLESLCWRDEYKSSQEIGLTHPCIVSDFVRPKQITTGYIKAVSLNHRQHRIPSKPET